MNNTPTNAQLRQFISQYFSVSELETFCFDYFPEIADELAPETPKSKRVETLIGYCQRRDLIPNLLGSLEKERPQLYQQIFSTTATVPEITLQSTKRNLLETSAARIEVVAERVLKPALQTDRFVHEKTGLEFVCIPAGDFLYGKNKTPLYLPDYWISKTPVTQKIYQRFIDAYPAYEVPNVGRWGKPDNWDKKERIFPAGKADHPVVLLSWYDAAAFCEWADVQLPTEQQWEKAARGENGSVYPWGNEWRTNHANTKEAKLGKTSAIGSYSPQGDSPYGCVDMSGNVWEWCLNKYQDSENVAVDKSIDYLIVRGGSWDDGRLDVRAAYRVGFWPTIARNNIGFRVVVVHRSPSHQDR